MSIFLLESANVTDIQFELLSENRIVVCNSTLTDFSFCSQVLTTINGIPCATKFASVEDLNLEIMCSATWPIKLGFEPNKLALPSPKRQRMCKPQGFWDLTKLSPKCCTMHQWEALKRGSNIPPRLLEELVNSITHGIDGHCCAVFGGTTKAYQLRNLMEQTESSFVLIPYQYDADGKWNLAMLCMLEDESFALVKMSHSDVEQSKPRLQEEGAVVQHDMFRLMETKLRHIITRLRVLPIPMNVEGSGFELLKFAGEFMKLERFNRVEELQENLLNEDLWTMADLAEEVQDMRQEVCEALTLIVSQETPQRSDLPPLPFPLPPVTAAYRELWDLFHKIDEADFIKEYLRTVPNGINMSVKYSKDTNIPIIDRRKFVWGECEEYLKTKFSL